jgi:hypothetical protein
MIELQLSAYGAISATGALAHSYKKHVDHYRQVGWPAMMDRPTREHLGQLVETHQTLIRALREAGYSMTGADLEVTDIEVLASVEWVPPPRSC